MVKKSFYVWVFRSISTIILVFIVAGVVNSLAGRPIYVLLNIIISPFTFVHHLMPKDTAWDGWKFIYTGMVLILELILCSGLVAFVYDVIRLGRSQFSESTLNAMARLLAQIEHSIQSIWGLQPHECRFYWLAGNDREYEFYSRHQPLNDLDKRVIETAILKRRTYVPEPNLRQQHPGHPAHEYAFIQNAGRLVVGVMVFINKPGVISQPTNEEAFRSLVEPIVSVDGTKEIVVELSKRRVVV